ncbi:E3 ubiquitin-protein ligase hrd1 [Diatrype stigma]|uniref:RING-type E3 ubiquitin transferase n=1 Tax=Diatrype stigma TaxID=117547 RepID=A0AAN9UJ60_9PEZI
MRLFWYAGTSAALATGVVAYAFNQRANFYSAMVFLSQNNLSLMILINLILLVYGSFVWGLQRLCYGPLRPVEIEQLYEKAWFAVTETCLAMTIFREEVGAWFLVMFTALVTGKVWEWIGEGRVEILEQQPPANPRLFHTRLSISLILSVVYDTWLFTYAVNSVIQQARPNMMVMFLFEFAILAACSFRTALRYLVSLIEADIVRKQTRQRLEARRRQIKEQRSEILRRRESEDATVAEAAQQEDLPNEEDVDEMDIEVPGWEGKGQAVLGLDLFTGKKSPLPDFLVYSTVVDMQIDFVKLGIYSAFFAILMMFYGLPIHIMRDLFMTARSFVKRLGALMRYRKALQDMNKYPDATQEELAREDTCIICREEMRPWNPDAGAVERSRPKKLPCGHILHFGCLKSWLERQQVCPTCRRSVVIDAPAAHGAAARMNGQPQAPGQPALDNRPGNAGRPAQGGRGAANMRVWQLGPLRLGIAQGNPQNINIEEMAQRLRQPLNVPNPPAAPALTAPAAPPNQAPIGRDPNASSTVNISDVHTQLQDISNRIQQEMLALQTSQHELQTLYALTAELSRLRQLQQPSSVPTAPPGQANPQLPLPQQLPFPVAPPYFQPGPMGMNIPMAPSPAAFANYPPRLNSPTITRYGGTSYTTAIPAGSPDLPDGVVIPDGWSLLPLQRLDGQPGPVSQGTQPMGASLDSSGAAQPTTNISTDSHITVDAIGGDRPSTSEPSRTSEQPTGAQHDGQEAAASSSTQVEEPPAVAAPTPVVPNWGGASQLFANGRISSASHRESETPEERHEGSEDSDSSEEDDHDHDDETSGSSSKGKAKAVTVEDAEDEQ